MFCLLDVVNTKQRFQPPKQSLKDQI